MRYTDVTLIKCARNLNAGKERDLWVIQSYEAPFTPFPLKSLCVIIQLIRKTSTLLDSHLIHSLDYPSPLAASTDPVYRKHSISIS